MWPNRQEPADLVTFTEEIRNGKLHFLCSEYYYNEGRKTSHTVVLKKYERLLYRINGCNIEISTFMK